MIEKQEALRNILGFQGKLPSFLQRNLHYYIGWVERSLRNPTIFCLSIKGIRSSSLFLERIPHSCSLKKDLFRFIFLMKQFNLGLPEVPPHHCGWRHFPPTRSLLRSGE
jgi:hypothetical protein